MSVETESVKGDMNADLLRLISLQKLDSEMLRKEKLLKTLPEEIKQSYSDCEIAKENLKAYDTEAEADKKLQRELESEIEDIREKIAKDKVKLHDVKTNVEYRAILKEEANYEKRIKKIEDRQLELMEKFENRGDSRAKLESILKEEEKKFAIVKKEKNEAIKHVEQKLEELKKKRGSTISDITSSVFKRYENLLKSREGLGVTTVVDRLCSGCNQLIPPQLYYMVRTSDKIYQCPHCSRYLYFIEPEDSEKPVE